MKSCLLRDHDIAVGAAVLVGEESKEEASYLRHARKGASITTKWTCRLSAQARRCSQVYGGLVICAWLARYVRSKVWTAQAITAVRKSSKHMLASRDGIRVADISNK